MRESPNVILSCISHAYEHFTKHILCVKNLNKKLFMNGAHVPYHAGQKKIVLFMARPTFLKEKTDKWTI